MHHWLRPLFPLPLRDLALSSFCPSSFPCPQGLTMQPTPAWKSTQDLCDLLPPLCWEQGWAAMSGHDFWRVQVTVETVVLKPCHVTHSCTHTQYGSFKVSLVLLYFSSEFSAAHFPRHTLCAPPLSSSCHWAPCWYHSCRKDSPQYCMAQNCLLRLRFCGWGIQEEHRGVARLCPTLSIATAWNPEAASKVKDSQNLELTVACWDQGSHSSYTESGINIFTCKVKKKMQSCDLSMLLKLYSIEQGAKNLTDQG